VAEWLKAPHC